MLEQLTAGGALVCMKSKEVIRISLLIIAIGASAALMVTLTVASAQQQSKWRKEDKNACVNKDNAFSIKARIDGCTALLLPRTLRRLYIARDADAAGNIALVTLTERAEAAGIEALALSPRMGDFNEDLQAFGLGALQAALRIQLAPQDDARSMIFAAVGAV